MLKKRLIPCLILKDDLIVQSIGFNRYLPIGKAMIAIEFVAKWDVDEIMLIDISATRESRKPNLALIAGISERCFVPLTVGGGIHSLSDIRDVIRAGADKIAVNTEALANPRFITYGADAFGTQCMVVSIDAKKNPNGAYEVYRNSGTQSTGLAPQAWAVTAQEFGAGEIFLNSIDRDGSKLGYDVTLIRKVTDAVTIPVIACGGVGKMEHFIAGITKGNASAVSAGNIFHYTEHSTIVAKAHLVKAGIDVRLNTFAKYQNFTFDFTGRLMKKPDTELEDIWFERFTKEVI